MLRGLLGGLGRPRNQPRRPEVDSEQLLEMCACDEFFPRPEWHRLRAWIMAEFPQRCDDAWYQVERWWLELVANHLGGCYIVEESPHFLLLLPEPARKARRLLDFAELARGRLLDILSRALEHRREGLHPLLSFEDARTYYQFLSYYGRDGEQAGSSGCFLANRYHQCVALWGNDMRVLESVLTHELTHALLFGCPIPLWLEEGLAELMPELILGHSSFRVDRHAPAQQRQCWSKHGLGGFWDGSAFRCPHRSECAYQLAGVLIRVIAERGRPLDRFVAEASWDDAGAAAASQWLDCDLGTLVEGFLGPGDWDTPGAN